VEKLILSSVRYTAQFKKIKVPPRIARVGVIEREPDGPVRLARAALAALDEAAEDQEVFAENYIGDDEIIADNAVAGAVEREE
jgi:hypothetical protein